MVSNATRQSKFEIRVKRQVFGRRWYVTLVAANGEPVATGEPYNSYQAAVDGCRAIKAAALDATLPTSAS